MYIFQVTLTAFSWHDSGSKVKVYVSDDSLNNYLSTIAEPKVDVVFENDSFGFNVFDHDSKKKFAFTLGPLYKEVRTFSATIYSLT
jgi:hypothetical protein